MIDPRKFPDIPPELMPDLQELSKQLEKEFKNKEISGEAGAGLVKVTLRYPGTLTKVDVDEKYFNLENKRLVEDLIVAAVGRAVQYLNEEVNEMVKKTQEKVNSIVDRYYETSQNRPVDSKEENLN